MLITFAHLVEIFITIAAAVVGVILFRHRLGKGILLFLTFFTFWYGVFSAYLATVVIPVREYVKITALGTQNEQSTNNHICITGYILNGIDQKLEYPAEGSWAWYLPSEKGSRYYCAWFPGTEDLQPQDATDYIVLPIPLGEGRCLNFLRTPWHGIAQVEIGESIQTIDTWGDGIENFLLPDTPLQVYAAAQQKQLPAFFMIFIVLLLLTYSAIYYITGKQWRGKLKKYQFLFSQLVNRDFTLKYKRTVLGMIWSLLSPLFTLVIMWFVFRNLLGNQIPHFVVYMFIGQLVFGFFSDATHQGMTSLLDNASIFTKINIPKYMFLFSKNISTLINFGLTLILLSVFLLMDKIPFTGKFLMLIWPISLLILFNIGLGLILSALFVFFRDMQYLWGIFTQLIMWVSAIFYSLDTFNESIQNMFFLNPVYLFIRYFRKIIIEGMIPSLGFHLLMVGYTAASLLIGAWFYKKYNHDFLYYI